MIFSMSECTKPNDVNSKNDISDINNISKEINKIDSDEQSISEDSSVIDNSNIESVVEESLPDDSPKINIYIPSDIDDDLCKVFEYRYDGTIEGLINKMVDVKALPKGTKLNSFKIENKIAYIDLSKEFSDALIGTTSELQYVMALVNTIIDCYDDSKEVFRVRYTVEGKNVDSGHLGHDTPEPFWNLPTHTTLFINENEYKVITYDGTVDELVRKLEEVELIPGGTKLLSFKIENDIGYVDLFNDFIEGMSNVSEEKRIITSLVNTLLKSRFNITVIKGIVITINGETLKTNNNTYDTPIEFVYMK